MVGVIGRDAVSAQIRDVLARNGTVVVDGPAGIGKSALWRAVTADVAASGALVLSSAPTESEAALSLAAIADVVRPLVTGDDGPAALAALPEPQRAAVGFALRERAGDAVDEHALGAATRTLLDGAAATGRPVLVAIDEARWLDPPSERALRFALRRADARIAVLVTVRAVDGADVIPLGLDDRAPERLELGPLGVGAMHHVLRERTGASLPRPLLARITRDAGGNPLVAIELARAVLRLPRLPQPGDDLPPATSARELVTAALAGAPPRSRDAVRLAALLTVPTLRDLTAAGVDVADLEAAEDAGLVTVGPGTVRFPHAEHAAAVRADVPPGTRRRLHAVLAAAVADPDERARHLARGTVEPDAAVARELTAAAARQRARGAPELAAELYDRAAELTPDGTSDGPDAAWRQRLAAARCRYDSGDYPAAQAAVDGIAATASGDARAEALLLRAIVAYAANDVDDAADIARDALASADPESHLAGRIHTHLAVFDHLPETGGAHAVAAARLLDPVVDPDLLASALMLTVFHEVRAGLPARLDVLDQAVELEAGRASWLASTVPAMVWRALDDTDRARERLEPMLEAAIAIGDEPSQHELLTNLADTELLAGRYAAAQRHVDTAIELAEQLGAGVTAERWLHGLVAVARGRADEAARVAADALATSDDAWTQRVFQQLAGVAALSDGRAADAAAAFARVAAIVDDIGLVEPLSLRFEPDWVEACVAVGDLATAHAAFDRLAARHARLPRPWTMLGVARGRVLLDAAAGTDTAPAIAGLLAALDAVPPAVAPLDRARCLLVAGVAHRRARRKREARDTLTAAAAAFDAIGAVAWAGRARAEITRIGGRAAAPTGLTATEERVARLAAQGRTNRAIADALFVSPKTVEANLARAYAKLGIASRAELGAVMASRPAVDS